MNQDEQCPEPTTSLAWEEALKLKQTEYWLKLGLPTQAFAELRSLPAETQKHPAVIKALVSVIGVLRHRNQLALLN